MNRTRSATLIASIFVVLLAPVASRAESLQAAVANGRGDPVADAVVYAIPAGGPVGSDSPLDAMVDQIGKEYVPVVTAVQTGTAVSFPNHDKIRHHVYSFSPAKTFEIPLYKGTPSEPIVFDRAGPVNLGCNIHDWMAAYVYVVDTPYFAVTAADGTAFLESVPPGDYTVRVWHPRLAGESEATSQQISVGNAGSSILFTIEQKRVWRPRRAPSAGGGPAYR